ncbi:MAG: class IV adenylate cyclase [Candidatus Promineifilaceae bacterium]
MLEVEVKFFVGDLSRVRTALLERGGTLKKARVFERNVRYDDSAESLLAKQAILRLRLDTKAKITYKGIPENVDLSQSQAKVREELEIEVSDFETANLLIQRIGYQPKQVYEKYRETFQIGAVEVVLDEMPYGDFVELEGPEIAIFALTPQIGLDWSQRILTNYLGLFERLKAIHRFEFNDLTFENFAGLNVSIKDVLG